MINPFANDSESMQIGELVIENQQDKVIIYGDIDIYRNSIGLEQAKQLHELTSRILQAFEKNEQVNTSNQSQNSVESNQLTQSIDQLSEDSLINQIDSADNQPFKTQNKPVNTEDDAASIDNPFL